MTTMFNGRCLQHSGRQLRENVAGVARVAATAKLKNYARRGSHE